jgi:hypothetical protein
VAGSRHNTDVGAAVATACAAVAAVGVAAVMLLAGPGGLALAVIVVLVALQVALLVALRGGGRPARCFLLAWSAEAGLTHAVAGDPTAGSALVYLGVGLVFALAVVVGLALTRPATEPAGEERRGDTQPLPVVDGD